MTVAGQLDYETRREYQLTVEATDTGGLRDSVPLTITLLDVNDNAPQFLRPEYRAFVKENRPDFDGDILITVQLKIIRLFWYSWCKHLNNPALMLCGLAGVLGVGGCNFD